MKTLLLRRCVPFGLADFGTVGIQFRRRPGGRPSGGTSEKPVCIWLSRADRQVPGAKRKKKKKKRTFSYKRREKERKEERIFAEFLKNQFVDSSSIYVERNFSPSSCAKTWIFVTTPHHHTSIRRALLLLALIVCKNRIHPFILLWKLTSEGERGRRLFELEDACSDVVAFAKNLYRCWKLEKNNLSRIHTVLTRTLVLCF